VHNTEIRQKLAAAYRIFALKQMDDLTYTHLSARSESGNSFFIQPFGLQFSEVKASDLLEVTFDGQIISGNEVQYNKTGYVIHGSLYSARPDLRVIFHLHTHAGVAVSAMKVGLLPISQFALHFYGKISYHKYDSLALNSKQGTSLIHDLGNNYIAFLENHGTLVSGRTIEEAMFYSHHLEQACKVQVMLSGVLDQVIIPSDKICRKANQDLLSFEKELGNRDWAALIRQIDIIDKSYLY
jgi:ribulose-5-phosphate 4-epimerase/fuculose-1-phosphate aldolase